MLERKFVALDALKGEGTLDGYASRFGVRDTGGDVVVAGAYAASLDRMRQAGRRVKMLWQHDPAQPIGVWDEVEEDAAGLKVRGRLLDSVAKGREAAALLEAGAIDGLSIGYRVVRAEKDGAGRRLIEVDLWEVSLVTFPMLPSARVARKEDDLARVLRDAREALAAGLRTGGRA